MNPNREEALLSLAEEMPLDRRSAADPYGMASNEGWGPLSPRMPRKATLSPN